MLIYVGERERDMHHDDVDNDADDYGDDDDYISDHHDHPDHPDDM